MSSITTWNRLEPLPRVPAIDSGLRAEIADPVWLLARQRQFGEFAGDDAGTPVSAQVTVHSARISRYHAGVLTPTAATDSIDYDDAMMPIESLVEREAARGAQSGGGVAYESGLHFLRLLKVFRVTQIRRKAYIAAYALTDEDLSGDDPATAALRRRAVGRVPDGRRLRADLVAARGVDPQLTTLPAAPPVPANDRDKVIAAANAFLAWWDNFLTEPDIGTPEAWRSDRLEHCFSVQADLPGGSIVLTADGYPGGVLDWYAFRAHENADLGTSANPTQAKEVVCTLLAAPVSYRGMPADRFWEIEDSAIRFGGLQTGRTDLARLLLAEFALTYGNDWFVIPVDLPVGSVARVSTLTVTDTFGETTSVPPAEDADWRMFQLASPVDGLLFLPPVLLETQESDAVEEVALFRDEMANVVWGVERTYQGRSGTGVDRYEESQRTQATHADQRVVTDTGDAQLLYRLATRVPEYWHPFVPVRAPGAAQGSGALALEHRPLLHVQADGSVEAVAPKGRILTAADPLILAEEEVPRDGVVVTRNFQLARWTGGSTVLWSGKRRRPGTGEGSSGLRFDIVTPLVDGTG